MKRIYTIFLIVIAAVLLFIFHGNDLTSFWDTDIQTTGNYYQETFFRKSRMNAPSNLSELNGKIVESGPHRVVYQFARPLNADIYIRPALIRQNSLMSHENKLFSYKNLKSLRLHIPREAKDEQLFHVANQTSSRIHLNAHLKQAPVFQLILDNSGTYAHSERVIGSLEIFIVDKPLNSAIPSLPMFLLFLIAPVIWCWFLQSGLGFSLPSSLGLAAVFLLLAHTLDLVHSDLSALLLPASVGVCLMILALRSWFEQRPLPTRPFFWALIWLATRLRWQEILIHSTIPINQQPLSSAYYQQAISMDLFSDKGFFSASFYQSPLYPFLLKLNAYVFGFSPLHLSYVSLLGNLLLLVLAYRLTVQLLESRPKAILVLALLSVNHWLIQETGSFTPDILSAALMLIYLLLLFSALKPTFLRGLLRGGILVLLVWNHLAFFPLACILIALDMTYQVRRSQPSSYWKQSLISASISGLILLSGFLPLLRHNQQHFGSFFPETTSYLSYVANLEFSDQQGFPSSLNVMMLGDQAPRYQKMGIREYLFDYHEPQELIAANLLGILMIAFDCMGTMLNVSTGENILEILIQGLSSQQNLLPILLLFLLEIFMALILLIFSWRHFIRYRMLLALLLVMILPHSVLYGVFMLKGFSLLQHQLDHRSILFSVPLLSIILIDALSWGIKERQRWLA